MSFSSFPTANRGEARRAYLNALRAADGLPPLPERPETTWRPVEPVAVALTSARPPVFVSAPEAAQGAVVSFFFFFFFLVLFLRACGVLLCTLLRCTYVLIFMYCIVVHLRTYFHVLYCGVLTYLRTYLRTVRM